MWKRKPHISLLYNAVHSMLLCMQLWLSLDVCVLSHFSRVQICATQWTAACQAPLSMGFSSQEYWSVLHAHMSYVSCIGRQVLYHWCHLGSPLDFLSHSYYSAGLLAQSLLHGKEEITQQSVSQTK